MRQGFRRYIGDRECGFPSLLHRDRQAAAAMERTGKAPDPGNPEPWERRARIKRGGISRREAERCR